jgi:hypothetical protein
VQEPGEVTIGQEFFSLNELTDLRLYGACVKVYNDTALKFDGQIGVVLVVERLVRAILDGLFLVSLYEATWPDHHRRPKDYLSIPHDRLTFLQADLRGRRRHGANK